MDSENAAQPQQLDAWFLSLLACPGCTARHPVTLTEDKTGLVCACGKYRFPVTDGIPILLVDSAEVLDQDVDAGTIVHG